MRELTPPARTVVAWRLDPRRRRLRRRRRDLGPTGVAAFVATRWERSEDGVVVTLQPGTTADALQLVEDVRSGLARRYRVAAAVARPAPGEALGATAQRVMDAARVADGTVMVLRDRPARTATPSGVHAATG